MCVLSTSGGGGRIVPVLGEVVLDVDGAAVAGELVDDLGGECVVGEEVQRGAGQPVGRIGRSGLGGRGLRGFGEFTGVQGHLAVGGLDQGVDAGDPVGD